MADLTITAANVDPAADASLDSGDESGATITAGMAVYKDSNGVYQIAHCETSSTTADVDGIAVCGSSDDQPIVVQKAGGIDLGATLTVGTIYVLSATGKIAPSTDLASSDFVTVLGVATTASNLKMGIIASGVQVP